MAGIRTSRFNWKPRITAWQQMQQNRQRAKAARADNEAAMASLASTLNTVSANQGTTLGELAAKRALARIQAEAQAKLKEEQAEAGADSIEIWKNKPPPKQVTVGDMQIDLANGTVKTSSGSLIDIKTGVLKVNLTA
jgi:hypothetical protein